MGVEEAKGDGRRRGGEGTSPNAEWATSLRAVRPGRLLAAVALACWVPRVRRLTPPRRVREYGRPVPVTDAERRAATADLVFWRAAVVVLVPGSRNGEALLAALTAALGPPRLVGGVELWDVRYLPVPPDE